MLSNTCIGKKPEDYIEVQNECNFFLEVQKRGEPPYHHCDIILIAHSGPDRLTQIPIRCRWYRE